MKYLIIICVLLLNIWSCTVEEQGSTESLLINNTEHQIKIIGYQKGSKQELKNLAPQETVVVLKMHVLGKTIYPNFGTMLQPFDWIEVVYDSKDTIVHQRFNSQSQSGIPYTNIRNLTNPNNYIKAITEETKHSITGYFSYTFTEQDYIDASQ
jgi:hypothetical protein